MDLTHIKSSFLPRSGSSLSQFILSDGRNPKKLSWRAAWLSTSIAEPLNWHSFQFIEWAAFSENNKGCLLAMLAGSSIGDSTMSYDHRILYVAKPGRRSIIMVRPSSVGMTLFCANRTRKPLSNSFIIAGPMTKQTQLARGCINSLFSTIEQPR